MKKKTCHCGTEVAWNTATNTQKDEWRDMDGQSDTSTYWQGMAKNFCQWCWSVRCDAYPGACRVTD